MADAVRFAEERDPVGTSVHLVLAMVFCASIALSTAMTSVSSVLLIGYTALRLPNLWRALVPLLASPMVWCWLGWTAWTALNGFWSADRARWLDSLGSFWVVAIFPALFPLVGRWRLLLWAFIVGATVQGLIQLGQAVGLLPLPEDSPMRPSGIGSHPGHVTTSAGMAILLVIAWAREVGSTVGRRLAVAVIPVLIASVVIAAGRGAILGCGIGLVVLVGSMAWRFGIPWQSNRLRLAMVATAVAIGGIAWLTSTGHGPPSLVFQVRDLEQREVGDASSVSKRYLWWSVSLDAFREHPVLGIGTGSLESYSSANPRTAVMSEASGIPVPELAARHPHSVYMLVAAEQGLVGIAWFGGMVAATLWAAWRTTAVRPLACGLLAGLAVWLVSAGFECLNLPMRTASMFVLFATVASLPRGPGVGLEDWREDPARG